VRYGIASLTFLGSMLGEPSRSAMSRAAIARARTALEKASFTLAASGVYCQPVLGEYSTPYCKLGFPPGCLPAFHIDSLAPCILSKIPLLSTTAIAALIVPVNPP
jgi:hypothetical protein